MEHPVRGTSAAIAASLLVSLILGTSASAASPKWCEDDPVVIVGHRATQITTKFAWGHLATVTGPVSYDIGVPEQYLTSTRVILPPSPVGHEVKLYALPSGSGEGVTLAISIFVPASADFETLTTVTGTTEQGRFSRSGRSNTTISFVVPLH